MSCNYLSTESATARPSPFFAAAIISSVRIIVAFLSFVFGSLEFWAKQSQFKY